MEPTSQRNWWKIGFFVLLFALEVAREIIVLGNDASNVEAQPLIAEIVFSMGGDTRVTGTWTRTDGGDPLVTTGVAIRCIEKNGICIEAAYKTNGLNVYAPDITIYDAEFGANHITFRDASSACMNYLTRIDLATKKVTRIRERRLLEDDASALSPEIKQLCDTSDDRIEMVLSDTDNRRSPKDPLEGHFLPIFSAVSWVGNAFDNR